MRLFIGATALQIIGLVCITVAVAMIKDGWYAVGAFGVALTTVAELVHRRWTADDGGLTDESSP